MRGDEQADGNDRQQHRDESRRASLDPPTSAEPATVGQVLGAVVALPHDVWDRVFELLGECLVTHTLRVSGSQCGSRLPGQRARRRPVA